jgi:hypothetical protein
VLAWLELDLTINVCNGSPVALWVEAGCEGRVVTTDEADMVQYYSIRVSGLPACQRWERSQEESWGDSRAGTSRQVGREGAKGELLRLGSRYRSTVLAAM